MNNNLKSILTFIAVFLFLIIAGFNSLKYWDKQDKEIELTREQSARDNQNDSLLKVVTTLQGEVDSLKSDITKIGTQKEQIKQVYVDKTKKDISKPAKEQNSILINLIEQ